VQVGKRDKLCCLFSSILARSLLNLGLLMRLLLLLLLLRLLLLLWPPPICSSNFCGRACCGCSSCNKLFGNLNSASSRRHKP